MLESDFDAFAALLHDIAALITHPQPLTPTQLGLYFRALESFPLSQIESAVTAHVRDPQRGRFFPKPADVIAQIAHMAEDDGRPGPEEGWAIALRSADEAETVVWTHEIAAAMSVAKSVLGVGDEVGARMAFREVYARLVDAARRAHTPVSWSASLGHDPQRRALAIEAAIKAGRLPHTAMPLLASPVPALPSPVPATAVPPQVRMALVALRDSLLDRESES